MPPLLHIMRHGQGFHSADVTKDGHLVHDPHLTEKGTEQCRAACEKFGRHQNVDLILASPLRRALQTASIAMAPCLASGMKIIAVPHAEEASSTPSDTGSPIAVLREEFSADLVDFDFLQGEWFRHEGAFATDAKAVMERARRLRKWISNRSEKEVVLVSHGAFAHFLTGRLQATTKGLPSMCWEEFADLPFFGAGLGDVNEKGEQTTPWWNEAELRTYTFGEHDADGEATMYETEGSLIARGGLLEDGNSSFLELNQAATSGEGDATEVRSMFMASKT